jgi:hypothetical protein
LEVSDYYNQSPQKKKNQRTFHSNCKHHPVLKRGRKHCEDGRMSVCGWGIRVLSRLQFVNRETEAGGEGAVD